MSLESKSQWKKLLKKAHHGDSEAQWEVGFYYYEGLVNKSGQTIVKQKPKKAFSWFLLSAEQGNEGSQLALANSLSTGVGTTLDFNKAIDIISILYLLELDLLPRTKYQPQIV